MMVVLRRILRMALILVILLLESRRGDTVSGGIGEIVYILTPLPMIPTTTLVIKGMQESLFLAPTERVFDSDLVKSSPNGYC